jgi:hypothetical protein
MQQQQHSLAIVNIRTSTVSMFGIRPAMPYIKKHRLNTVPLGPPVLGQAVASAAAVNPVMVEIRSCADDVLTSGVRTDRWTAMRSDRSNTTAHARDPQIATSSEADPVGARFRAPLTRPLSFQRSAAAARRRARTVGLLVYEHAHAVLMPMTVVMDVRPHRRRADADPLPVAKLRSSQELGMWLAAFRPAAGQRPGQSVVGYTLARVLLREENR